jgi:hypothetical protein
MEATTTRRTLLASTAVLAGRAGCRTGRDLERRRWATLEAVRRGSARDR